MNRRDRQRRFERLLCIGCMACRMNGEVYTYPEIHHMNSGGKAGQKRLGDAFTFGLCAWHHRGEPRYGTARLTEQMLGPSLARTPRRFRARYGTDSLLLAAANALIEVTP